MVHTSALLVSALSLIANLASAVPAGKGGCDRPVRMISVRGSDEILGDSVIKTVFSSLLAAGTNGYLQGTPYPAIQDGPDGVNVYVGSESAGVSSLKSIIQEASSMCPQQKIVLVGYSQGAQVVMDSLCGNAYSGQDGIGSQYTGNVAAAVLFGDPSHNAGQSFLAGGGYNTGMVGRPANTQCAPYTDKILSICHSGDPVCNSGSDMTEHLTYMPAENAEAVQFIQSKI